MLTMTLPGSERVPQLGQGTWTISERPAARADEIAAPRNGVARDIGATPAQVALAWTLHRADVIAISKARWTSPVRENRAAADLVLSAATLAALNTQFPRPARRSALETL